MIFPCPLKSECPEQASPLTGASSEAADSPTFIGTNFGFGPYFPPLGSDWSESQAVGFCDSQTSQSDADTCAARSNLQQLAGNWPGYQVFYNSQQNCTAVCPDGLPFTHTVGAGQYPADSQQVADAAAAAVACELVSQGQVCLSDLDSVLACLNVPFTSEVSVTGNSGPYSFSIVSGTLPTGTSLMPTSPASAAVTGTPTATGDFTFTIQATDALGNYMQKEFTVEVMGITNMPGQIVGIKNSPLTFQLNVGGNVGATVFSVTSGSLPTGITLTNAGKFTGTPTVSGSFTATVTVSDVSHSCSVSANFTITSALDWSGITWDQVSHVGAIILTASGASFNLNASAIAGDGRNAFLHGSLLYNGPAVNCLLTITGFSNIHPGGSNIALPLRIPNTGDWDPNNPLAGPPGVTNPSSGKYVIPFLIGAGSTLIQLGGTSGNANQIVISTGSGQAMFLSYAGTFSNV